MHNIIIQLYTTVPTSSTAPDFLAILSQNGIPKHELRLKEGCICSLMCNISVQKGPVKNARLIVQHLHRCNVEVRKCIPQIRFEFTPPHVSWTVHRLQFPLQRQPSMVVKVSHWTKLFSTCTAVSWHMVSSTQHFPVSACEATHPFFERQA
jgi:hypothetical protein